MVNAVVFSNQVIDKRKEHFKLMARNKTVTIESKRPLFRNKGLKHCRFDLKILDDNSIWNITFKAATFEQIKNLIAMFLVEK